MIIKLINPITKYDNNTPELSNDKCRAKLGCCERTGHSSGGIYLIIKKNGKYCIPIFENRTRKLNGKINHQWEPPYGTYEKKHKDICVTASQEGWEESGGLFSIQPELLRDYAVSYKPRIPRAGGWHAICIDNKILSDHICKENFDHNRKTMIPIHESKIAGNSLAPAVVEMIDIRFIGIDEIERCKNIYKTRSVRDCDKGGQNGSECNFPMKDIDGKVCDTNLLSYNLYEKGGYELIQKALEKPLSLDNPSWRNLKIKSQVGDSPYFQYNGKQVFLNKVKTIFIMDLWYIPSEKYEFNGAEIWFENAPVNQQLLKGPVKVPTETREISPPGTVINVSTNQTKNTKQTKSTYPAGTTNMNQTMAPTQTMYPTQTMFPQTSQQQPVQHNNSEIGSSIMDNPSLFSILINKIMSRKKRKKRSKRKRKKTRKRRSSR